jgi:hypothetical protein
VNYSFLFTHFTSVLQKTDVKCIFFLRFLCLFICLLECKETMHNNLSSEADSALASATCELQWLANILNDLGVTNMT